MTNTLKVGRWNPARVMTAIGRIGYHPVSAILDIADNSLSNGATEVALDVVTMQEVREGRGRRKAIIAGFRIVDNGWGMSQEQLDEAIALGSSDDSYTEETLSKFGMGLKSASASLGRRLAITSRAQGEQAVYTLVQDQDVIESEQNYVYELRPATNEETDTLDTVAKGGSGTLVEITKVHTDNLPGPAEIVDGLKTRAGVVYYFALASANPVTIRIGEEPVEPFDPLFEADCAGDLFEADWDGLSVRWIQRTQPIQLSEDGKVKARVTMTQLPHPPSVAHSGEMSQAQARAKYMIGAGHYGFYIYRNGRLTSWADSLGIVPQDQDLYSFRGRFEIGTDADDVLNIDVTKSRLHLSEIAQTQLEALLREAVKKSKTSWGSAKRTIDSLLGATPHDEVNEALNQIGELEQKNDEIDEAAAPEPERKELEGRRRQATTRREATQEEQDRLREQAQRVQYVTMLENNQLWSRAHDPTHGLIVRVNSSHRLIRDIVEPQRDNAALIKVLDVIFYGLAQAEYELVYKSLEVKPADAEILMDEFRERAGGILSEVVRQAGARIAAGA